MVLVGVTSILTKVGRLPNRHLSILLPFRVAKAIARKNNSPLATVDNDVLVVTPSGQSPHTFIPK